MKNIIMSKDTLKKWSEILLPDYDLFFVPAAKQYILDTLGNKTLIMPWKEFQNHSTYDDINVNNSYMYWQISKEADYVSVAHPDVIAEMSDNNRTALLIIQKEMNRGLIFEWSKIEQRLKGSNDISLFGPYKFLYQNKEYVALQTLLWKSISPEIKDRLLIGIAEEYLDESDIPVTKIIEFSNIFPHISAYFNQVPAFNGANCLAATLASLSETKEEADWLITHWIHDETFLNGLKRKGYGEWEVAMESLMPKDVLLWKDNNNRVQHASFHLGDGYFFNKNGQSFINPWQVITLESLIKTWGIQGIHIYRNKE